MNLRRNKQLGKRLLTKIKLHVKSFARTESDSTYNVGASSFM